MTKPTSLVLALCLAAPACADLDGDPSAASGPGWESAATTLDDGAIIIQKVTYRSGGLRVFGQVCRPAGQGPFPLVVRNHGGFTGLGSWNGGPCAEAARAGYVQIEPSFRGQDGSDGAVELCHGEVDDALRMLELALAMPEVDPARVAMWGASHGGCVTARALQRGAPVTAAASLFGMTDLAAQYEHWRQQLALGAGPTGHYQTLIDLAHAGIGGAPEDYPEEYQRRSVLAHAGELPAGIPYLIAHGAADPLVPPMQSCALAAELGLPGHHFDAQHQLVAAAPLGCEDAWTASAAPLGGWPGARYLLVYDGLALALAGDAASAMDADLQGFLSAKVR